MFFYKHEFINFELVFMSSRVSFMVSRWKGCTVTIRLVLSANHPKYNMKLESPNNIIMEPVILSYNYTYYMKPIQFGALVSLVILNETMPMLFFKKLIIFKKQYLLYDFCMIQIYLQCQFNSFQFAKYIVVSFLIV